MSDSLNSSNKQPPSGTGRSNNSVSSSSRSYDRGRGESPPRLNIDAANQFGQTHPPEQKPPTVTPDSLAANVANWVLETPQPPLNPKAPSFEPQSSQNLPPKPNVILMQQMFGSNLKNPDNYTKSIDQANLNNKEYVRQYGIARYHYLLQISKKESLFKDQQTELQELQNALTKFDLIGRSLQQSQFLEQDDQRFRFLANKANNKIATPQEREAMKALKAKKIATEYGQTNCHKIPLQRQRSQSLPPNLNDSNIDAWDQKQSGSNASLDSTQSDFPKVRTWNNHHLQRSLGNVRQTNPADYAQCMSSQSSINPGSDNSRSRSSEAFASAPSATPGLENVTDELKARNLQKIANLHLDQSSVVKYVQPHTVGLQASTGNWRYRAGSTSSKESERGSGGIRL